MANLQPKAKEEYEAWHLDQARVESAAGTVIYPWHRTALKLLPCLDNKDVLEIGCGRGDFAILLAKKNPTARITAVDFSESAIQVAKTKTQGGRIPIIFEVGDATSTRFPKASFDYVISCECMEHVPEPQKMANEIARLLKPHGDFLITTENYLNGMLLAWIQAWLTGRSFNSGSGVQPHENFFVYWRVCQLLEATGLSVEHMESNHFQWLLLPRIGPARLCTEDFRSAFLKRFFRPFGRHFTYVGRKREIS